MSNHCKKGNGGVQVTFSEPLPTPGYRVLLLQNNFMEHYVSVN